LDGGVSPYTALLKELATDHFECSFGGETPANLMMKVSTLAPKKPAR
jgi:hypothetical protein